MQVISPLMPWRQDPLLVGIVVDKSPWLEMLKNVIGSGALVRYEVGNWFKSRVVCKKASGKTLADGVLHVVRIELTARSHHISWSVYPNYEYHYFSMYLIHLWLVEITCRLECISAAAKWSPNATHKTVGRPRYSQLQVRLANREFPCPNFWLSYFC